MMSKLILHNFQCHKDLEIDLSQITILCGNNYVGKSAVLRALAWVCLNEWSGEADSMVSWDEQECEVTLVVDKHSITRSRIKGKNIYSLDGVEYKAFRSEVPEEIRKILNVGTDNFQMQQDTAFWISLGSGEAASALNEIFNLTVIDDSLYNAGAEVRTAKGKVDLTQERLTKVEKEVLELAWVEDANKKLTCLEKLHDKIEEKREELAVISSSLRRLESCQKVRANAQRLLENAQKVLEIGCLIQEKEEELEQLWRLQKLEDSILNTASDIGQHQRKLNKWLKGKCPLCQRS